MWVESQKAVHQIRLQSDAKSQDLPLVDKLKLAFHYQREHLLLGQNLQHLY